MAVLSARAGLASFLVVAMAAGALGDVLFWDGFESDSFSPESSGSPYYYFDVGWKTNEGSVLQEEAGGRRGDDSFIFISDQPFERSMGKTPVVFPDQPKYFVFVGAPFSRADGGPLTAHARMTGALFNVDDHPYGAAVTNAQDDFRIACVGFDALDLNSGLAFTIILTNAGVWVSYERLPTFGVGYRAFQQVKRVANRWAGDLHDLYVTYDRAKGEVHYYVDKEHVHTVTRFGLLAPDMTTVLSGATGEYTEVEPGPLNYGFGTFALLALGRPQDGANIGLVNLSLTDGVLSFPSQYSIEDSDQSERVFGQGASLRVFQFDVYEGRGPGAALTARALLGAAASVIALLQA